MLKIDYQEAAKNLSLLLNKVKDTQESIHLNLLKERLQNLEKETQQENFWEDKERFTKINKEISRLKKKIEVWDGFQIEIQETLDLMELALSEQDHEILESLNSKIEPFQKKFISLETKELLAEEDDFRDAFLIIHPGAGGTESQDWASMLFRMYCRWGEKNGFSLNVIDFSPGEEAGLKDATILFKGDYAFGFLKGEKGVHRLVRHSPFDTAKRRHTSFASVDIVPDVESEIEIEIEEKDLRIDTYRSSGAGGQHVNKSDSAVRITHLPTGIVVQCQNERSQHKNKSFALKVLKARLYNLEKDKQNQEQQSKSETKKEISWGNQIRSYVFQPYTLVKDHRTDEETGNIEAIFDGNLNRFIYAYLRKFKEVS